MIPEWNLYDMDEQNNPEHDLFESVNMEINDISGFPVDYFIRKLDDEENIDNIYGENAEVRFSDAHRTKISYEPSEESSTLTALGFMPDDNIQFAFIPKGTFLRDIAEDVGDINLKPKIGDIILTLWNNRRYEVTNISADQSIFQGKKMIWELILTPYRFSKESDSADSLLYDSLSSDDFPDINSQDFETKSLTAYDESSIIDEKSDEIYNYEENNKNTDKYGY